MLKKAKNNPKAKVGLPVAARPPKMVINLAFSIEKSPLLL